MHLTIDGFGGDRELLSSETLVHDLLVHFPGEINMTRISEPNVFRYVGVKPEDWGITGFVIIAESHISVHTFPERGYVWVDIFSCKEFEAPGALDRIISTFGLTHFTEHILERGLEFPHAVDQATPIAHYERFTVTGALSEAGAGAGG
jgi:S-adenosylmethionine decarboxylase